MKHLKIFEDYSLNFAFEDENLKIEKILYGNNKDKISFRFYIDDILSHKSSLMYGCSEILDSKYENNVNVRKIEIGGIKFRQIHENTIRFIIDDFLKKTDYDKDFFQYMPGKIKVNTIRNIIKIHFTKDFTEIIEKSKNLGEVLDKLKRLRNEILDFLIDYYEEYQLNKDTNKYNL